MNLSRAWDAIAVAAVAVVLLLPKASLEAHAAAEGDAIALDRMATLEAERQQRPQDVEAAIRLADEYLDQLHPDWALATTARFAAEKDPSPRLLLVRATAHAERLEADATVATVARIDALCAKRDDACAPAIKIKSALIGAAMQSLLDEKIDPNREPRRAREAVSKALRAGKTRPR